MKMFTSCISTKLSFVNDICREKTFCCLFNFSWLIGCLLLSKLFSVFFSSHSSGLCFFQFQLVNWLFVALQGIKYLFPAKLCGLALNCFSQISSYLENIKYPKWIPNQILLPSKCATRNKRYSITECNISNFNLKRMKKNKIHLYLSLQDCNFGKENFIHNKSNQTLYKSFRCKS